MVSPLVDLTSLDLTDAAVPNDHLRDVLPHDHEFRLIDRVCYLDPDAQLVVGYKDWGENPWWARGHMPGRPIMPGVLMVEGCAQIAVLLLRRCGEWAETVGLGEISKARFRRMITPPARVYFVARLEKQGRRMTRYRAQCFADGEICVDTELVAVPL